MDEARRKYRLLYFLLDQLANKDKSSKLNEILTDHKLTIANPSLIAFKKAFQSMRRLNDIEKKEVLINFEKEIHSRLEIVRVLERNLSDQTFVGRVEELQRLEQAIDQLNEQLRQLSKEYADEAIDYIDNYACKFKSLLDIHQLNYDLNQLQNVLVKIRLEKAERTYSQYGDEEKIDALRREREQLQSQLKQLNLKEQQLVERKRLIEQMDADLVSDYKNLKNNYKITEWVMNTLEK